MVTQDYLRSRLDYDPATGTFTWKHSPALPAFWNAKYAGRRAGSLRPNGYVIIRIDGRNYRAHRLAWLHVHGEWPSHEIDHRNRSRDDNDLDNLASTTSWQNHQNKPVGCSGARGVTRNGSGWTARIRCGRERHYLGTFDTPEAAHAAYVEAAERLHGINASNSV